MILLKNILHFLLVLCAMFCWSCSKEQKKESIIENEPIEKASVKKTPNAKTNIISLESDSSIVLPKKLLEISGLEYDEVDHCFWAINDEKGHAYKLDKTQGKIIDDIKFYKHGDYEGIALSKEHIYVCKSNGDIYRFSEKDPKPLVFGGYLSQKNDIEGMCYLEESNLLLLTAKGQPKERNLSAEGGKKDKKGIYAFDLKEHRLLKEPYVEIFDEDLLAFAQEHLDKLKKNKAKKLRSRLKQFAPSGISIHPKTKDYYIISAKGSTLVVLGPDLHIKKIALLNAKSVAQPEGICFDKQNNLYISTEGKGLAAKIFLYSNTQIIQL